MCQEQWFTSSVEIYILYDILWLFSKWDFFFLLLWNIPNKWWNTCISSFCCIKLRLKEGRVVSVKRWIEIFHYFIQSFPFPFSDLAGKITKGSWHDTLSMSRTGGMEFLNQILFFEVWTHYILGDQNSSCWDKHRQEWPIYCQEVVLSFLQLAITLTHHLYERAISEIWVRLGHIFPWTISVCNNAAILPKQHWWVTQHSSILKS